MQLARGFNVEGSGLVCKLEKWLYALEQSPIAWFDRFSRAIGLHGYRQALQTTRYFSVTMMVKLQLS